MPGPGIGSGGVQDAGVFGCPLIDKPLGDAVQFFRVPRRRLAVPLGEAFRRHGHREGFRLVFRGLAAVGFGLELAAAVEPFAAFWEISVPALIGNQPWAFAGGLLLALLALPRLLPPAAPRAV